MLFQEQMLNLLLLLHDQMFIAEWIYFLKYMGKITQENI